MDTHFTAAVSQLSHVLGRNYRGKGRERLIRNKAVEQPALLLRLKAFHADLHQKTVQLRFRQRIAAERLHRVLCRHNKKRILQQLRLPVHRDLLLRHALQKGRLGPRSCAVDLIGQKHIGEHGPRAETEAALRLIEIVDSRHVTRKQVRRKLDAPERQIHRPSQGLRHDSLSGTGHVFEEHMPSRRK